MTGLECPASKRCLLVSDMPSAQSIRCQVAINKVANRSDAVAIAIAAKRLNELREAWLNPPEWTQRVPEVIPLGMTASLYRDRIVRRPGHEKDLAACTLTKLYNAHPVGLDSLHTRRARRRNPQAPAGAESGAQRCKGMNETPDSQS